MRLSAARFPLAALAAGLALALIAAGCSGGVSAGATSAPESGASITPASVPLYVSVDTAVESEQWRVLQDLLEKFPGKDTLLDAHGLDRAKFASSVGDEVDVVVLDFGTRGKAPTVIGLTRPKDEAAFNELLEKGEKPFVHTKIDGWTVFSSEQSALDAFEQARSGERLADSKTFLEATGRLPAGAPVKAYLNGSSLAAALQGALPNVGGSIPSLGRLSWLSGSLEPTKDGVGLRLVASSKQSIGPPYASQLVSQVPAGALLYVSFNGLDKALGQGLANDEVRKRVAPLESLLGVTVNDIVSLFGGEGALYVRQGAPLPEVTLVLQVDDEAKAIATVDKLAAGVGGLLGGKPGGSTQIAGVTAKTLQFGGVAVYYAGFDGKLVITDSTTGISGLRDQGQKLADDPVFKEARDRAGMPDKTIGFLYLNLKDGIPVVQSLARTAGKPLPSEVTENLAPLRSLLLYGASEGTTATVRGFLEIA